MERRYSPKTIGTVLLLSAAVVLTAGREAKAQQVYSSQPQAGQQSGDFQQPPAPDAAQLAAMRKDVQVAASYQLPDDFLPRMITTLQALQDAGLQPPPPEGHISLDDTIKRVESVQGIEPVLRAQGFSARQFVMGLTSFGITYAVTSHEADAKDAPHLNPHNVALLQKNPEAVRALLQQMGNQPAQAQ
ncbi:hypothetical protein [Acetobacter sp.]|uniref:hypothetical protein n=1 Tax=Acetobacter sp. TaxID=440 RepID=UPI0025B840EF|nr:hypothetical protein [Acetobacter sp.]MCH4091569.1 hypothetical protein [Acetobacter sp.]